MEHDLEDFSRRPTPAKLIGNENRAPIGMMAKIEHRDARAKA
jgi:hypothetical protein